MTDRLITDTKGTVVFILGELRTGLLSSAAKQTPEQLIDNAIAETLAVMESHFELSTQLVCTPEGLPVTVDGLVKEYWDMVNDDGN